MNDFIVVYSTELMRRIKSRPFQIGLLIGIVSIALFTKLPDLLRSVGSHQTDVVLAAPAGVLDRAKALLTNDYTIVATTADASTPNAASLKSHNAVAWISITDAKGLKVTVYAKDPSKDWSTVGRRLAPLNVALATDVSQARLAALMAVPVDVQALDAHFSSAAQADAAEGIAFTLLIFLYMLILINSQLVMSSVAEEKTSRIAELLVASISPVPLLYGKIAVATTLALLQLFIWVAVGLLLGANGMHSGRSIDPGAMLGGGVNVTEIVSFLILFLLGFGQLSMLMAGLGSLVNRTEDLGSVSIPVVMPVVFAFILAITAIQVPDLPWIVGVSFVPLVSPFVMFARIAVTDVPIWQIALCVAINLVALWAIAIAAGKLYRVGMLLYGRAPNFKQVWQVIRS